MSKIILEEQAAPSTPAANKVSLYPKAGGGVYKKNDAGTEKQLVEAGVDSLITSMTGLDDDGIPVAKVSGATAEANLQPPAPVAFASSTGYTITHNYGHTDYQLIINPVADPSGFLGEIWISKAANTAVVYNSGSATGNFDYVIIPSS